MNYDPDKYKIWNWKSPVILHWMINPGLIVNELILGQTIPKIMLIEKDGSKPLYQKSFIPCPHCNTLHSGLKWSSMGKMAFKNWFGYYCDNCGGIIPVQRNLTSLLILGITFPVWGWFGKAMKQKWLGKQAARYQNLDLSKAARQNTTARWLKAGLFFGLFMYICSNIITPLIKGEPISQLSLTIGIPVWLAGGLIWGYIMKAWMNK